MLRLLLVLTLPLYLLDQLTKWWILGAIPFGTSVPVVPGFFNLVHVYNTGAAFGMFAGNNMFFIALSVVAIAVVLILVRTGAFRDRFARFAVALLIAGILGNLTDRLIHGHVVDFLDVILPWYGHWPAFNVADSCICIAAGLFIVSAILDTKKNGGRKKTERTSAPTSP